MPTRDAPAFPLHAPMDQFPVVAGELVVGGIPLTRLAARVGQTPFYAYDRSSLSRRVAELRAILPPALRLHYAMKANPMPALVGHMVGLVDGLDVASGGELRVALDAGADPKEISFAGPGKTPSEISQAVAAGVLLNVESPREVAELARISAATGRPARVAVRVNPDFELKSSGMKMGGGPKPFGVDAERVPELLDDIRAAGLAFEGFHLFAGSQNLKADAIIEAQQKSYELARRLAERAPRDLPSAALTIELGRYLVGEAGVYVSRIIDRKVSRGQVFLVTDGGLHHHLSASGNFGQVIRKNYPVAIGNRMDSPSRETATVVGPLCTPLDLLADKVELPVAEPGDLVVIFQSGAYGMTASPQAFLSHPAALEVLV